MPVGAQVGEAGGGSASRCQVMVRVELPTATRARFLPRRLSNFLASSVEQFLDDVLLRASTDPVRHMRLAALQRSRRFWAPS
jgi:hypothetical protein